MVTISGTQVYYSQAEIDAGIRVTVNPGGRIEFDAPPVNETFVDINYPADFGPDPMVNEDPEFMKRKDKNRLSQLGRSTYGPQKLHRKK